MNHEDVNHEDVNHEDVWFEMLAETAPLIEESAASSCFKSRMYSRLIEAQEQVGPLAPLDETSKAGVKLCVFERIMTVAPSEALQQAGWNHLSWGPVGRTLQPTLAT